MLKIRIMFMNQMNPNEVKKGVKYELRKNTPFVMYFFRFLGDLRHAYFKYTRYQAILKLPHIEVHFVIRIS